MLTKRLGAENFTGSDQDGQYYKAADHRDRSDSLSLEKSYRGKTEMVWICLEDRK